MRAWIYDLTFRHLTAGWYREVLSRLPRGAHLLDVGIGTGGALASNADLVRRQGLRVTGVDIDEGYVRQARRRLEQVELDGSVEVRLESIYEHAGGPYDAAYFSASFMLLPDPAAALRRVRGQLAPGGRIFFTQTFENRRSPFMERTKPLLKRLTTIDFGQVTYLPEFEATLAAADLGIVEVMDLKAGRARSYRLVEGRPRAAGARLLPSVDLRSPPAL